VEADGVRRAADHDFPAGELTPAGLIEQHLGEIDRGPRISASHGKSGHLRSKQSETFKVMERRLLRAIINPAMIVTWLAGLYLAWAGHFFSAGWFHGEAFRMYEWIKALHVIAVGRCRKRWCRRQEPAFP